MSSFYIGIDPSTSSTGVAVLNEQNELVYKDKISGAADDPKSFANLYVQLTNLLERFPPVGVVCENQFIGMNRKTGIKTVRPTGVVLACVGALDTAFSFAYPSEWRKVFEGAGKSHSKQSTFTHVQETFPGAVSNFKKENDISDAIGLAYVAKEWFSLEKDHEQNG